MNKGQALWDVCRDIFRVCRNVMRKAKNHLILSLARDVKDNKNGFFKYVNKKRGKM